jgi:poly(3-hydroxybutyrate) depolymerase
MEIHHPVLKSSVTRRRTSCVLALGWAMTLGCSDVADGDGEPPSSTGGSAIGGSAGATAGSAGASSSSGGNAGRPGTGGGGVSGTVGGAGAGVGGEPAAGGSGGQSVGGSSAGSSAAGGGGGGAASGMKSQGCGHMRTLQDGSHMVQSGGTQRSYVLRVPPDYDSSRPYRLMLGFHGAGGKGSDIAPSYFGLWELAQGSTIFAAPDAVGGLWKADTDTAMVSDLLTQLKGDLCIDTSRIELEGFSQGGAMVWTLACALPGTFRLAVVHSGGGLAMPKTCQPIPFLSSLGHDGSGQGMSSDFFAMTNGCMVESLPLAPTGGHACTDYKGCTPAHPTRFCAYDGGHTPAPTDSGQNKSWMPQEVWSFVKQY